MNHLHIHAIVLGFALVVASGIVYVRRSGVSDRDPSPRVEKPVPGPRAPERVNETDSNELEKALGKAEESMKEAREILKLSGRSDNNQAQMLEARKLLDEASALIESLPQDDPDVKELRRQWSQLKDDSVRLSNL